MRTSIVIGFGAAIVAACAVIQPPPGGPEDKTPPRVSATIPKADSARVARTAAIEVIFSEKVDPQSLQNRVSLFPPVEFGRLKVRGNRLEIGFKRDLPETTFCLLIGAGVRDYHGVESKERYILYFSTADSLERGRVSGSILFRRKADSTGVAELFTVHGDSAIDLRTAKRARVAFAEKDGRFVLPALPTDGSRFLLRAFDDRDGDGHFSAGSEFAALFRDTISLTRLRPRIENVQISIVDPDEPGSVEGRVVNETKFKLAPTVRLGPVKQGEKPLATRADSTGNFSFAKVPPGAYVVSAFIDLKADTLCGTYFEGGDTSKPLNEPCVTFPDTLRLGPGETTKLRSVSLR